MVEGAGPEDQNNQWEQLRREKRTELTVNVTVACGEPADAAPKSNASTMAGNMAGNMAS